MPWLQQKIVIVLLLLIIIFSVGISGYVLLGWKVLDAVYMTVIFLSTVGYGEIQPLSGAGRIFTIFLILTGLGVLFYGITSVTAFIVEGELRDILGKRKMDKTIAKLKGHFIVCGLGKTGRHVVAELIKTESKFVAVEKDIQKVEEGRKGNGILLLHGDATKSEVPLEANIEHAQGLVTTLPSDSENLFLVLTAREINPSLRIVSRVIEEEAENKLYKVGADSVVSTNFIGGLRMASELIRPSVVSFLDLMLRDSSSTLRVSETMVPEKSGLSGMTILEADFREKAGVLVLAIRRKGEDKFIYDPSANEKVEGGDILIVLGDISQVNVLDELLKP